MIKYLFTKNYKQSAINVWFWFFVRKNKKLDKINVQIESYTYQQDILDRRAVSTCYSSVAPHTPSRY